MISNHFEAIKTKKKNLCIDPKTWALKNKKRNPLYVRLINEKILKQDWGNDNVSMS